MANNVVKELNEIKDNYDADIKDGTNVVDALDGIREAIEQDGEWTSSKNVAEAIEGVKEALEGASPTTEFRNFTYTNASDGEDIVAQLITYEDGAYKPFFATAISSETWGISDNFPKPENKQCKLPVINGKCEMNFITQVSAILDESSTGCALTEVGSAGEMCIEYKLSINEDNAIVNLSLEV